MISLGDDSQEMCSHICKESLEQYFKIDVCYFCHQFINGYCIAPDKKGIQINIFLFLGSVVQNLTNCQLT